jgi:hypothetical protein
MKHYIIVPKRLLKIALEWEYQKGLFFDIVATRDNFGRLTLWG